MQALDPLDTAAERYRLSPDEAARGALFEQLVARHGGAIRRLCLGFERDAALRDELEQDVLLALWRALPGFAAEASLRTWLMRIAHNRAATHVARQVRQPRGEPVEPASATPLSDEMLDAERARARLAAQVSLLPVPDRQLMLLYLEGLPSREIGEITGLSPSNVTTRLSRLKAALIQQLREEP